MSYTATYSPEDNKLRLYASERLSPETYARVKAAGFSWAPKQELFVAPMWTPNREDLLIEMAGEIEDEDTSVSDRAAKRAERFSNYSEKRADDAERASAAVERITEHIPFGQPILIGHHSERHARKDAEKIRNGMNKTVQLWKTASYWTERAAGALAHAKYKELPGVRLRRIKGIEADLRKSQRNIAHAEKCLAAWGEEGLDLKRALTITNYADNHFSFCFTLDKYPREAPISQYEGSMSLWSALDHGIITAQQAHDLATPAHRRTIARESRWIEHFENRLAYERAMLGDFKAPEKPKRVLLPLTNFRVEGCEELTAAEWKRKPNDYKGTRTAPATAEHGAYRYRVAMVSGYRLARVFVSDEKVKDAPKLAVTAGTPEAVDVPRFQPTADAEEKRIERDSEMVQSRNVYAEARAEVPRDTRIPSYQELHNMEKAAKAGVQVVSAPQLFPTPSELARRMVQEADVQPGHRVLEPSAGTGNIVDAIHSANLAAGHTSDIIAVEINLQLAHRLAFNSALGGSRVIPGDFMEQNGNLGTFDRIVMNPPFVNAQDIAHIKHAAKFLKPGGRLVAICAGGPRQERELKPLAEDSGGIWEPLPSGTFKDSGTNVNTVLLIIEG